MHVHIRTQAESEKLDRLSQLFVASKGQKHFSQIWRQKLEVRVGEGAKFPYV